MTAREMEVEAAIFWRASRTIAAIRLLPTLTPTLLMQVGAAAEELEAVSLHSEWPKLRAAAARVLAGGTNERAAV